MQLITEVPQRGQMYECKSMQFVGPTTVNKILTNAGGQGTLTHKTVSQKHRLNDLGHQSSILLYLCLFIQIRCLEGPF